MYIATPLCHPVFELILPATTSSMILYKVLLLCRNSLSYICYITYIALPELQVYLPTESYIEHLVVYIDYRVLQSLGRVLQRAIFRGLNYRATTATRAI
jgi:hypothetical protein